MGGGRGNDNGLDVHQRGEIDQRMMMNEKGLWVRKRTGKDALENGDSTASEDPRLEAAKPQKRRNTGGKNAEEALKALQDRRKLEMSSKADLGLMRRSGSALSSANLTGGGCPIAAG